MTIYQYLIIIFFHDFTVMLYLSISVEAEGKFWISGFNLVILQTYHTHGCICPV